VTLSSAHSTLLTFSTSSIVVIQLIPPFANSQVIDWTACSFIAFSVRVIAGLIGRAVVIIIPHLVPRTSR
jgi:hypothetical protein